MDKENRIKSPDLKEKLHLHPNLCQVFQPRWDPHRDGGRPAERCRSDGSRLAPVLRSWNGTGLVHDRRLALIVVHVEARRRGLRISVATRSGRVRGHRLATVLSHGVAWITWTTDTRIESTSQVLSFPLTASLNPPSSKFGASFKLHKTLFKKKKEKKLNF